jgi:hypothetical protein
MTGSRGATHSDEPTETSSKGQQKAKKKGPIPILVLGDWVVDENWVLAGHRSSLSTLEGSSHLRALGTPKDRMVHLGGAGCLANYLYRIGRRKVDRNGRVKSQSKRATFDVYGVGLWAGEDDREISRLFDVGYCATTQFTLRQTHQRPARLKLLHLYNLQNACPDQEAGEIGTIHIFRLYQHRPDRLELDSRIDFDLQSKMAPCIGVRYEQDRLDKLFYDIGASKFEYAVLVDLAKGTVSSQLLESLCARNIIGRKTNWFILFKGEPEWLSSWKSEWGRRRLVFLHPDGMAQLRITDKDGRAERFPANWFVNNRRPVFDAVKGLENLSDNYLDDGGGMSIIVARPRDRGLLALVKKQGESLRGVFQPYWPPHNVTGRVVGGGAELFLAMLASELIPLRDDVTGDTSLGPAFEKVLEDSYKQDQREMNRLMDLGRKEADPEADQISPESTASEGRGTTESGPPVNRLKVLDASNKWNQAQSGAGIIVSRHGRGNSSVPAASLDLWRAMCEVDDVIETNSRKRQNIGGLVRFLGDFIQDSGSKSFSALLIAPPGSGKTHLVSRLAKMLFRTAPLSFNITQMVSREDIVACFDGIASAQAQDRRRHLVFFDEINAMKGGSRVYDLFLSVLEEGTYLRHGQLFQLDPCAWIFASTEPLRSRSEGEPSDEETEREQRERFFASKEPDFCSRLTLKGVNLSFESIGSEEEETRRGFVYLGAALLQQRHRDVRYVSAEVLRAFHTLPIESSVRDIRRYAERFRDIHYGKVTSNNMPGDLKRGLEDSLSESWQDLYNAMDCRDLDDVLVRINAKP